MPLKFAFVKFTNDGGKGRIVDVEDIKDFVPKSSINFNKDHIYQVRWENQTGSFSFYPAKIVFLATNATDVVAKAAQLKLKVPSSFIEQHDELKRTEPTEKQSKMLKEKKISQKRKEEKILEEEASRRRMRKFLEDTLKYPATMETEQESSVCPDKVHEVEKMNVEEPREVGDCGKVSEEGHAEKEYKENEKLEKSDSDEEDVKIDIDSDKKDVQMRDDSKKVKEDAKVDSESAKGDIRKTKPKKLRHESMISVNSSTTSESSNDSEEVVSSEILKERNKLIKSLKSSLFNANETIRTSKAERDNLEQELCKAQSSIGKQKQEIEDLQEKIQVLQCLNLELQKRLFLVKDSASGPPKTYDSVSEARKKVVSALGPRKDEKGKNDEPSCFSFSVDKTPSTVSKQSQQKLKDDSSSSREEFDRCKPSTSRTSPFVRKALFHSPTPALEDLSSSIEAETREMEYEAGDTSAEGLKNDAYSEKKTKTDSVILSEKEIAKRIYLDMTNEKPLQVVKGKVHLGNAVLVNATTWTEVLKPCTKDSAFTTNLLKCIWTREEMAKRSVSGSASNRSATSTKKIPLTPAKKNVLLGAMRARLQANGYPEPQVEALLKLGTKTISQDLYDEAKREEKAEKRRAEKRKVAEQSAAIADEEGS